MDATGKCSKIGAGQRAYCVGPARLPASCENQLLNVLMWWGLYNHVSKAGLVMLDLQAEVRVLIASTAGHTSGGLRQKRLKGELPNETPQA